MGMPTMARVVESEGSLAFRCGDCGAAVLDLRCGCPQCKVDLVGLLVEMPSPAVISDHSRWVKSVTMLDFPAVFCYTQL